MPKDPQHLERLTMLSPASQGRACQPEGQGSQELQLGRHSPGRAKQVKLSLRVSRANSLRCALDRGGGRREDRRKLEAFYTLINQGDVCPNLELSRKTHQDLKKRRGRKQRLDCPPEGPPAPCRPEGKPGLPSLQSSLPKPLSFLADDKGLGSSALDLKRNLRLREGKLLIQGHSASCGGAGPRIRSMSFPCWYCRSHLRSPSWRRA